MKKNYFVLFFLYLFCFFIFFENVQAKEKNEFYEKIDLFGDVLETIESDYIDEIDKSKIMDSAINGVLQSLDPYSAYMSPEVYKEMQTDTKGEFGGLGIEVGMEAGVVKVISPIEDSPAYEAGVKAGDYIIKIDDEQVQGKSLMEAVKLMRGKIGTPIEITIRRKGLKKSKVIKIIRDVIKIKSVSSKIIEKNIGYMRLRSFSENTQDQLNKVIKKFEKNKSIEKYILDLRNNPGGLLTQAVKITDMFLNDGEIVSTRSRDKSENRRFFARKGDKIKNKTYEPTETDMNENNTKHEPTNNNKHAGV